jgi:hypothetical protein
MTSLKLALLWVSAGVLVVCLGMFSTAAADHQVAKATPTMTAPAAQATPAAAPAQSTAPTNDLSCQASANPLSLGGGAPQAACPTGSAWTCCRCGGCGCRPQHISPTNWCAC